MFPLTMNPVDGEVPQQASCMAGFVRSAVVGPQKSDRNNGCANLGRFHTRIIPQKQWSICIITIWILMSFEQEDMWSTSYMLILFSSRSTDARS